MYNIQELIEYINQKTTPIILPKKGGKHAKDLFKVTNIGKTYSLETFKNDVTLSELSCNYESIGSTTFSERVNNVESFRVDVSYCPSELLNTWVASYALGNTLPFEAMVVESLNEKVAREVDAIVFGGKKEDGDINDGLFTIADADDDVLKVEDGSSISETLYNMAMAIPESADIRTFALFMSKKDFKKYVKELSLSRFRFRDISNPFIPNTPIPIIVNDGVPEGRYLLTSTSNVYLENKSTEKSWLSEDGSTINLTIKGSIGVQYAYPEYVIVNSGVHTYANTYIFSNNGNRHILLFLA